VKVGYPSREVFNRLLRKGVIVRAMDGYGFPDHIRVTVGTMRENIIFINKLKEVLEELKEGK
jgi:histidinol-phosphate aminotransferase